MTNIEELIYRFRWQIVLLLTGMILVAGGLFLAASNNGAAEFEIVEGPGSSVGTASVVEVSGAVEKPGVYEVPAGARVEDAIKLAGGFRSDADGEWIDRYLNRAAFLSDGQKIYIPRQSEVASDNNSGGDQTDSYVLGRERGERVNINTASKSQLESLYGIGPVYAQKVIDNRPYSSVEELLMKKVITQKIYEKNKDLLTVY